MNKINIKGDIIQSDMRNFYKWAGWDYCCPYDVEKALNDANGEEVVLEINSPGGIVTAGYEIYTLLKQYTGRVTAHIICAASAATLPACAADEALISNTGVYMIHNTQSSAKGDYRDMDSAADTLRQFNEGIINAYTDKTGLSRKEIQRLMDNATYMSPQRAVEYGFADDYMFGEPKDEDGNNDPVAATDPYSFVAAVNQHILPTDKARMLMEFIKKNDQTDQCDVATAKKPDLTVDGKIPNLTFSTTTLNSNLMIDTTQNPGLTISSEIKEECAGREDATDAKKGDKKMDLKQFLTENPDAAAEYEAAINSARDDGAKAERERMRSLDAIASTVTPEALNEAKYGDDPCDGPALAYKAMVNGQMAAAAYMQNAIEDTKDSGAEDVGNGAGDGLDVNAKDDDGGMSEHVNKKRGGKK